MSVASATRRALTVHLRESYALADAGRAPRVDREAGIIYGVKIVGRSSPNKHNIPNVDGTDYTLQALEEEAGLLEGMCVNVDHRKRDAQGRTLPGDRSARDRFAWLQNVKVMESGSFGDLHFLDPSDPLAVRMFNAAEKKPDAYALSHDAPTAKYEIRGRRLTIVSIPYVRSVDIVADGGTNVSLFEGREALVKTTIAEKWGRNLLLKPKLAKLLEAYEAAGDTEVEPEGDHMDDLYAAFKKLVGDDPEKAKKVLKLIKDEAEPEVSDQEDDEEASAPDKKEGEGEVGKKGEPEEKAKAMESLEREVVALRRENMVNRVALHESVALSDVQREAAMSLPTEAKVRAFVKEIKASGGAPTKRPGGVRSQGYGTTAVSESREIPADAKAQAALLLR